MQNSNRINGYLPEIDLQAKSSEGAPSSCDLDREPHQETTGHIIHHLSPEQASRLSEHEAASLFSIKDADLKRLSNSIGQFGQQVPVVLYEGKVLDGRCRIKACFELGIPVLAVRFGESDLNDLTPKQWVLHRNRTVTDGRRMTDSEYALIVAAVYGAEASEQARLRKKSGVKLDDQVRGETSATLGTIFNLSPNLLKQALKLFKSEDADLLRLVKEKKLSLSKASEILSLPKAKRKTAMQNPKAPVPLTSAEDAFKAFNREVKSLEKVEKRISQIAACDLFSNETLDAVGSLLVSLHGAIACFRKSYPERDQADSKA